MMRVLVLPLVLLTARDVAAQETIDLAVGSPVINWRLAHPYSSRFEAWRHSAHDSALLFSGTNVVTHRDSTGTPQFQIAADASELGADGRMSRSTSIMTFDQRTFALHAPPSARRDARAFYGPTADLVVEFLPRRLRVAYRTQLWFSDSLPIETHFYETKGREDIDVFGKRYRRVWIVEDSKSPTAQVASRLWLIDEPPYMLRWVFYNAPSAGDSIVVQQERLAGGAH